MKNKGFTLIELMIVIAIIAIIAAIAIPSLIRSRISANEGTASAGLKTYNGMMATFKKGNYQARGRRYPRGSAGNMAATDGKFCALYYEVNNAGDRVTLIGIADAKADCRANGGGTDAVEGLGDYQPVTRVLNGTQLAPMATIPMRSKAGYWVALCMVFGTTTQYNGTFSQNHYGLVSFPADYGSSGQRSFCINEEGTVYSLDFGVGAYRDYPGADPAAAGWEIEE